MSLTLVADQNVLRVDGTGTIRVGATRVTLDTLAAAYAAGAAPEQIATDYPAVGLADVYAALGYYLRHRAELDDYLARRREAADASRGDNPDLYPSDARERLLARRGSRAGT